MPCAITGFGSSCTAASPIEVEPGHSVSVVFLTVVVTSLNSTNTTRDALTLHAAASASSASLFADHETAWGRRWSQGSISVEGDLALARSANASLYSLRSSIRHDWAFGLSPGGLASDGYNGHTFWDQETWMWPPLLMLDPLCAKSALQYRFNRQAGARLKAKQCGSPNHAYCQPSYVNANGSLMFPWESAFTGDEVQCSGGGVGRWGKYEQHISGDISFAARQYYYATKDREWLQSTGFPLILGVAKFYAERATPSNVSGHYDILQVMPPDEYAYPVDNSAYTNTVASLAIAAAIELAPLVGRAAEIPSGWQDVAKGLGARLSDVPEGSGLTGQYHPEYQDYPELKGKEVKQADAVMLSYPFGAQMSAEVLANDLSWYDPHTNPNGPAMTWAIFAIGWFHVGNFSKASPHFLRGYCHHRHACPYGHRLILSCRHVTLSVCVCRYRDNMVLPFLVWRETPRGGCTPFLTGTSDVDRSAANVICDRAKRGRAR